MEQKDQININFKKWVKKKFLSLILSCTPISTIKNLIETIQWIDKITSRKLNTKEKTRKTSSSIISIIWRIRIGSIIQEDQENYIDPKIEIALRQILGLGTQITWIYHSGELQNIIKNYKSSIYDNIKKIKDKWKKLYKKNLWPQNAKDF